VHAFEPIPETFDILRHVVAALGLANVVLYPAAVADREGELTMEVPREGRQVENYYLAHLTLAPRPAGSGPCGCAPARSTRCAPAAYRGCRS
jgi:FkbM family methyltransferase